MDYSTVNDLLITAMADNGPDVDVLIPNRTQESPLQISKHPCALQDSREVAVRVDDHIGHNYSRCACN